MTISNTSRTAGPFIGNGINANFPFAFKVFTRQDLLVARTVTSTGVETALTLDADYTVTLNADQNTSPGGVIHMIVPPPAGTTLAATSNVAIVQALDLTNNGGFYPKVINDALDRMVINIQQLAAKVGLGSLNIGMAAAVASVMGFIDKVASSLGASLIGFVQLGADAVLRTIQDVMRERVSVKDFGAKGDFDPATGLGTDDWSAIQKAITYLRTTPALRANGIVDPTSPYLAQSSCLLFPPGRYLVTKPVWFGIDSAAPGWNSARIVENVQGYGAVIVGRTNGKAVIDMSGAFGMKVTGLTVFGDKVNSPKVGILLARSGNAAGDNPSAGAHRFTDVNVHGDFTLACVYNYASEINVWSGCFLYQNSGKTVYLGTSNNARFAVTSDYCTLATSMQSAYGDYFSHGIFKSSTGNVADAGAVFYLESLDFGPSIFNSYIDTSGAVYMPSFFLRNAAGTTSDSTVSFNQGLRVVGCTFEYRAIQDIIAIDAGHIVIDMTLQGNSMPILNDGNRAHISIAPGAKIFNLAAQRSAGDTLNQPLVIVGGGEIVNEQLAMCAMRKLIVGEDWEYTEATLNKDGTFYTIDLANQFAVPKNAKFIAVKVMAKTAAPASDNAMHLRGAGVAAAAQWFSVTPQVAGIETYAEGLVPVVNGQIQYRVPNNFVAARILFRAFYM